MSKQEQPRPANDLAKALAGSGFVPKQAGEASSIERALKPRGCPNCYFSRVSGCRRYPLDVIGQALPKQDIRMINGVPQPSMSVEMQFMPVAKPAPPDYVCGDHRFEREVIGWRWEDVE